MVHNVRYNYGWESRMCGEIPPYVRGMGVESVLGKFHHKYGGNGVITDGPLPTAYFTLYTPKQVLATSTIT